MHVIVNAIVFLSLINLGPYYEKCPNLVTPVFPKKIWKFLASSLSLCAAKAHGEYGEQMR
jgi:hypothetical protein